MAFTYALSLASVRGLHSLGNLLSDLLITLAVQFGHSRFLILGELGETNLLELGTDHVIGGDLRENDAQSVERFLARLLFTRDGSEYSDDLL